MPKVTIPVELDVDDVRSLQQSGLSAEFFAAWSSYSKRPHRITGAAHAAALRFELPWEPSEQDVTARCEADGFDSQNESRRTIARDSLLTAHRRGWDAVPRRIGSTDG